MNIKTKMGDFCSREYFERLLEASQPQETKENDTGNKESKMRDLTEREQEKYEELILGLNEFVNDVSERETLIELVDELVETLMED